MKGSNTEVSNRCPACGIEFDYKTKSARTPSTEITEDGAKVCARVGYDKHNYAYAVLYVHEPVRGSS